MAELLGQRERKKAATHRAIADAALDLFSERGLRAVGVREVAEAADVSTATVFKHFPARRPWSSTTTPRRRRPWSPPSTTVPRAWASSRPA